MLSYYKDIYTKDIHGFAVKVKKSLLISCTIDPGGEENDGREHSDPEGAGIYPRASAGAHHRE